MSPLQILLVIVAYFGILIFVSWLTSRNNAGSQAFFIANKSAPWYLVAIGMIGTSLSGVTFISVPGQVGKMVGGAPAGFAYMQVVMGYLVGYFVIATVLMPMYYRLNLVSIYGFLQQRFGFWAYKTGAAFFLLSRSVGSAARFYLVIGVLHFAVFQPLGMPFWLTALLGLGLIWLYTFKGGLKTILYTDTLQSFFMLLSLVISVALIAQQLGTSPMSLVSQINETSYSQTFVWDFKRPDYFWKQFISGALIAITMTGLDQDMMQKNLSCRSLKEAQKNMLWFCVAMVIVNLTFMYLGASLYIYSEAKDIALPAKTDQLFPMLALNHFLPIASIVFVLGIIAATYASTDSALAALTTSFCIDFLDFGKRDDRQQNTRLRIGVHLAFTLVLFALVLLLNAYDTGTLITTIFQLAGYTYGPLLGLFAFGMLTRRQVTDHIIILILALLAPTLTWVIASNSQDWFGYVFGFEIILLNGLLMFAGLLAMSRRGTVAPKIAA